MRKKKLQPYSFRYNDPMKGAILISGQNKKARGERAEELIGTLVGTSSLENNPDYSLVETLGDKKSIGISQIREGIKYISQKPFANKNKILRIPQAELLTIQAQNALLKTLEELPTYATIILETKSAEKLLPTIVSRCQRINIKEHAQHEAKITTTAKEVLSFTRGERLTWAVETGKEEKEEIIKLLENWIIQLREQMLVTGNVKFAKNIELVTKFKTDFENTNVNAKLGIETLVINLI